MLHIVQHETYLHIAWFDEETEQPRVEYEMKIGGSA